MTQNFFRQPSTEEQQSDTIFLIGGLGKAQLLKKKQVMDAKFSELNRLKILKSTNIQEEALACFNCFWLDYINSENTGELNEYQNYQRLYFVNHSSYNTTSQRLGHEPEKDELSFKFRCKASRLNHGLSCCFVKKELPVQLIESLSLTPKSALTKQELALLDKKEVTNES